MKREWEPGDVALVSVPAIAGQVATWATRCFSAGHPEDSHWHIAHRNTYLPSGAAGLEVRPLVVIDPEDREQVERLLDIEHAHLTDPAVRALDRVSRTQILLREFANPTPPKPEEPTGLGDRVRAAWRDDEGRGFGPCDWVLAETGEWVCLTDGHVGIRTAWGFLQDVEVPA